MTPVTIAINVVVIPLLLVIVIAWGSIAAGLIRRAAHRLRDRSRSSWQPNLRSFIQEMGASLRSLSVARTAGVFYFRPIEGMLVWTAMVVAGMILMAMWAGLIVAIFGHYP
jgi:hypothetical protein